ncbi:acetyltransferase (GNAT) family protein [Stackebrandtia endophytica]|uniref:Acetyltransferase (GNAT) family protein n=1 Tax=Stackebrandtia endophytica TaxID=1496996 RepID=A0A543AXZ4_9ACTN|nr:GNAT family N-acetyltransferase [Stackebrandtia endophytica]TQL77423.1 acetyltransferase (GNAT) family protein [Stackebrandtia endophytica]
MSVELLAEHRRRWSAIDRLVDTPVIPEAPGNGRTLKHSDGYAVARRLDRRPDEYVALWSSLREYRCDARIRNPEAIADLLSEWIGGLPEPDDDDTELTFNWPGRDVAVIPLLIDYGFRPKATVAIRRTSPPVATPPSDGIVIRELAAEHADAAVDLWREVIDWDNRFLRHPRRPDAVKHLRAEVERFTAKPGTAWVAEVGGAVVGLLVQSVGADSEWIQPLVEPAPVGYLNCLVTTAGHRGGGVGAALVDRAHRTLADSAVPYNTLHYNALNPLSGPFWNRAGYRPLWTNWSRPWRASTTR